MRVRSKVFSPPHAIAMLLLLFSVACSPDESGSTHRNLRFTYTATFKLDDSNAKSVELWLPLWRPSRYQQQTGDTKFSYPPSYHAETVTDPLGNHFLHVSSSGAPSSGVVLIRVTSIVTRTRIARRQSDDSSREQRYLEVIRAVSTSPAVSEPPRVASKGDVEKVEEVLKQTATLPNDQTVGTCDKRTITSVSYLRSSHFPTKFVIGVRVPPSASGDAQFACWIETKLGLGYVPVDLQSIKSDSPDANLGFLDENRIDFGDSADAEVSTSGPPTEDFARAYALRDGKPLEVNSVAKFADVDGVDMFLEEGAFSKLADAGTHLNWSFLFGIGVIVVVVGAIIATVSTIAGKLQELNVQFLHLWLRRRSTRDTRSKFERLRQELATAPDPLSRHKRLFDWWVREAESQESRYSREFRWSARSAWLFSFSQYVLGGLITASPFLTKGGGIVSFFGFLVLFTSLIQKFYNPTATASLAKDKADRYAVLLNETAVTLADAKDDSGGVFYRDLTHHLRTKMAEIGELAFLPEEPSGNISTGRQDQNNSSKESPEAASKGSPTGR